MVGIDDSVKQTLNRFDLIDLISSERSMRGMCKCTLENVDTDLRRSREASSPR